LIKEKDNRNVPMIIFSNIIASLYASATFYKPSLVDYEVDVSKTHQLDSKMSVTLDVNRRTVKQGNNVHIQAKPILKTMIRSNSKMTIALKPYKELVEYSMEILNKEFNIDDEDIQNFLWIYNLDFAEITKNMGQDLITKLMKYGLDLDIYHSKALREQCISASPSGLVIYNRMSSYKYYIKGLMNDANIFSRFNYFYIDSFITSSGRKFSKTSFINLQGFKLTKALVIFKSTCKDKITEKNFEKINNIIAEKLSTPACKNQIKDLTYENYVDQSKELYEKYIASYLKADTNIADYPIKESYINQIRWLSTRIKKPRDMFFARLIITNDLNKEKQSIIYELDATSSGLQLIGILTKSTALARISNVIGDKYLDIYKIYAERLEETLAIGDLYLKEFLLQMNLPTVEELIAEERLVSIKEANTFGKLLKYFLYCDKTEIPAIIEEINKAIIFFEQKHEWKFIRLTIPTRMFWMLNTAMRKVLENLPKNENANYLIRLLVNARVAYEYRIVREDTSWLNLKDRNIYKKPIMAYGYSMGYSGRIAHYSEYIFNIANEKGIDHINPKAIGKLSEIINQYFHIFEKEYLTDATIFLELIAEFISDKLETEEKISISTKYATWQFARYKVIKERIRLLKHQLALYTNTDIVDKAKAITSFSSIFIHSIDAYIVYCYQEKILDIIEDLKINKIFLDIGIYTNHDNFGINIEMAVWLKIILAECYNNMNDSEVIAQLTSKSTEKKIKKIKKKPTIECENPNFVKH
jgi:hypothetical protein